MYITKLKMQKILKKYIFIILKSFYNKPKIK